MEDELFEGLQILTPQEIERSLNNSDSEEDQKIEEEKNDELTITEVKKESETVKEGKENEESKSEEKNTNENRTEIVYKGLLKELVKEGIITGEELDKLPGNLDTIKQLVNQTVENNVNNEKENWKKSFTGAKKRFLEIEDAFTETDQAIIIAQKLNYLETLDEDSIKKDTMIQKQIYFELLKGKNFSDDDAIEHIKEAEELGKLEEKSLKAFPELKKNTLEMVEEQRKKTETKTKEELKAQTESFEKLLQAVDSKEYFIEGLNLNKIEKEKLKANIINPVYKDEKTGKEYNSLMYKQMKNPAEFEMLINHYDRLGLFNITKEGNFKPDISKIKAVAKSAAVNELDKIIASEETRTIGKNTSISDRSSKIVDLLEKGLGKLD